MTPSGYISVLRNAICNAQKALLKQEGPARLVNDQRILLDGILDEILALEDIQANIDGKKENQAKEARKKSCVIPQAWN